MHPPPRPSFRPLALALLVRNGIGAMPSFSEEEIPDEQMDALIRYMVWLRRLHWKPRPHVH